MVRQKRTKTEFITPLNLQFRMTNLMTLINGTLTFFSIFRLASKRVRQIGDHWIYFRHVKTKSLTQVGLSFKFYATWERIMLPYN